jgi:hypothetical protein
MARKLAKPNAVAKNAAAPAVPTPPGNPSPPAVSGPPAHRPGRNEPCHCGSGRKYKHCCLEKDERLAAAARVKAAAEAASRAPETASPARVRPPKHETQQPWKAPSSHGFVPRTRTPRKVGGS